ncbi:MAG: glycosyltransferase family 1 protein [Baekduia sp.]
MEHVGLNLLYLVPGEVGGTEILARRLIDALARARPDVRFTVFCGIEAAPSLAGEGWPENVVIHRMDVACRNKPRRILAELFQLPREARRAGVDLLHSLGTTSPLRTPCPSVVSVHDLIYLHYPETFPPAARLGLKLLVGPGARRADRVLALSEAAKRDLVEHLRLDPDRVHPVHIGGMRRSDEFTPEAELRGRLGLGEGPVVLCVSAALRHKNLPRLIDAFAEISGSRPDARLVLVGHHGLDGDALRAQVVDRDLDGRVIQTGWIADADLEGLYRLAACCAYPSLLEGFGIPVLEAMARGLPVACADATSLPEVAGDAALLFDPLDTHAIAAAIERLLSDEALREQLRERGLERAAGFTWEKCAEGVLAVYELALSA